MFEKWLESKENANWNQLLDALKSPAVDMATLASKIEWMLVGKSAAKSIYTFSSGLANSIYTIYVMAHNRIDTILIIVLLVG